MAALWTFSGTTKTRSHNSPMNRWYVTKKKRKKFSIWTEWTCNEFYVLWKSTAILTLYLLKVKIFTAFPKDYSTNFKGVQYRVQRATTSFRFPCNSSASKAEFKGRLSSLVCPQRGQGVTKEPTSWYSSQNKWHLLVNFFQKFSCMNQETSLTV